MIQAGEGGPHAAAPGAAAPDPAAKVRARRLTAPRGLGRLRDAELAVALFIIVLFAVLIVFAPMLGLPDPISQHLENRLLPPGPDHFFGTDQLGRDVFSRVLNGGRTSLPAAVAVVAIGFAVGTLVGAVAGFLGGAVDQGLSRGTDMFLAFPVLVLAMAVAAALGASLINGVIALAVVWWMSYMRVSRGMVLDLKNRDYVVASRAAGRRRIRHPGARDHAQRAPCPARHGSPRYRPSRPPVRHAQLSRPRSKATCAGVGLHGRQRRNRHGAVVGVDVPGPGHSRPRLCVQPSRGFHPRRP